MGVLLVPALQGWLLLQGPAPNSAPVHAANSSTSRECNTRSVRELAGQPVAVAEKTQVYWTLGGGVFWGMLTLHHPPTCCATTCMLKAKRHHDGWAAGCPMRGTHALVVINVSSPGSACCRVPTCCGALAMSCQEASAMGLPVLLL